MTESEMTKNRIIDLSRMSYERGIYTYSDFLTLAEQSDFNDVARSGKLYTNDYSTYGGFEGAERVMLRFGSEDTLSYDQPWPISCIKISPLNHKFSEDLSHRDILGSLMNLGIERHLLGDILIPKKSDLPGKVPAAYVFVEEHIADTLCHELTRVRHTSVIATIIDNPSEIPKATLEEDTLQVKSERIDLVVAHTFNLSRSQAADLFLAQKIFLNGRIMENESHTLKSGDIVSVRSYGRFIYQGSVGTTRKGNLIVTISRYV